MEEKPTLSIVVPVYNEEENVRPLFEKIQAVCEAIGETYEVLFVDDGSRDETFAVLAELSREKSQLVVIRFQENAGQTAAMAAGFEYARGQRIISMDGDLQNDPGDIPKLLQKLDEGYDLVCGWRKDRQDKFWTRRVPSIVANWIIGKVTGVPIHDNGCSLKAYRASVIKQVSLYGEMHRFIPAMSTVVGARIAEIVVTHHPRRFGKSKYGLGRIWRVMLDIIAFKFIISVFAQRPTPQRTSLWERLSKVLFRPKQKAFRVAAFLSLPFFVLGRILFGNANIAALSCLSLAIVLLILGWITEDKIRRGEVTSSVQQETPKLGALTRFFSSRCKRRPIRFFGPIGVALFILGGILPIAPISTLLFKVWNVAVLNLSAIFITSGILVFCFGLFGELITFANAKQVKDYTVETLLNF
ncbi:MAG: glycosyltransferase family 2 protein [Candidatus Poribacteria bacterium]|nr:glycosyltransferase family 2 protein [Candidatus Poribacteria bacterium]